MNEPRLKGFDKIEALYGKLGDFHDAHVFQLTLSSGGVARMHLYDYGPPEPGFPKQDWDDDLHCIEVIEWAGVSEFEVVFSSVWLDSMAFEVVDNQVRTTLVDQDSGRTGAIVSASVEVLSADWAQRRFTTPEGESLDYLTLSWVAPDCRRNDR